MPAGRLWYQIEEHLQLADGFTVIGERTRSSRLGNIAGTPQHRFIPFF
jgi:hypothetical protein